MGLKEVSFYVSIYHIVDKKDTKKFIKDVSFLNNHLNDKHVLEVLLGEDEYYCFHGSFAEFIKMLHMIEKDYDYCGIRGDQVEKFDALMKSFKNNYVEAITNYIKNLDLSLEEKAEKVVKAFNDCKKDKQMTELLLPLYKKYLVDRATTRENNQKWEEAADDWFSLEEYERSATCYLNAKLNSDACVCYVLFLQKCDYDSQTEKKLKELVIKHTNEWIKRVYNFVQQDSIIVKKEWEDFSFDARIQHSFRNFKDILYENPLEISEQIEMAKKLSDLITLVAPYEGECGELLTRAKDELDYCVAKGEFVKKQ